MATRAFICYKNEFGGIKGVYNHWAGHPSELGREIVKIATEQFINNRGEWGLRNDATIEQALEAFIQCYIKGHPGGWSEFGEKCYCHTPEFLLRDGYNEMKCSGDDCFVHDYTYVIIPYEKKMEVYGCFEKNLLAEYDFENRKWIIYNNEITL